VTLDDARAEPPIAGVTLAEPQLLVLHRLLVVVRTRRIGGGLFAPQRKVARWVSALRVCDALASAASQFEIGEVLVGVAGPSWRVIAASERLWVQCLVAQARRHLAAGPATWLAG
jgi:hypothetical protein